MGVALVEALLEPLSYPVACAAVVGVKAILRQRLGYTPLTHMYRIVLACKGVPADVGAVAARDIAEEFTRRP